MIPPPLPGPFVLNWTVHDMTVRVKICGLSTKADVECAISAGADFIGLMFYPPSPRNVDIETGARLADMARGKVAIVAITVDADDALIDDIMRHVKPDYIQAHGSETPRRVAEMSARAGKPVLKAIKVKDAADIQTAALYAEHAGMILFDAKAPESLSGALPGGNGLAFDWTLLGGDGARRDFMLSGGLDADNVARAIEVTGAPIVDISSGVETAPGKKDCRLIRNFIEAAKAAR
jgi:phosphoribosylanthranilate isomerase